MTDTNTTRSHTELYLASKTHHELSITEYIEHIFNYALTHQACDIHIEPFLDHYRIRFRIDGLLHPLCTETKEQGIKICTHLKVLAQLNIAEHRRPQDGRAQVHLPSCVLDFRLSSLPTLYGEKIVMRLQNTQKQKFHLDTLGFSTSQLQNIKRSLAKPQGLILITGPTGSGKTVSLYAALKYLNAPTKNLSTVEDPVEISLDGVNQVQANPQIDLSFAHILRALLRQDPDILMIGEIRDLETADIALKAAQTGHLVLSSLHTHSAYATLNRLINLGLSIDALVQSLELVIAQRLLRKLCPYCKQPNTQVTAQLKQLNLSVTEGTCFYQAQGCSDCYQGYKGRIAVYEMMPMSPSLRQALTHGHIQDHTEQTSQYKTYDDLFTAGLHKAQQGLTSLDEVLRVIPHPTC
tara:strand:- start:19752 stop:20975 length:1224 start_codon:yes stop_codon:yes gene_type:complete